MSLDRTKILDQAQKHLQRGALDKAIIEYQKLVKDDPQDVRTWLKIGDLYTRTGSTRDAVDTYGRVAETYAQQGFFLKAVAVYKQILKLDPQSLDTQLRLAGMYEHLALVSDALATYEQVAAVFAREGQLERGLQTMARMVELDPENIPVRIKLAESLSKAGKTAEAATEFEAGARLLREQGRIDDFIKVGERLLFHRPDDVKLARDLATLYLERNDAKRALAKLQSCFKADPKDVVTLELLGQAFLGLQQQQKTISVFKEIARIHQDAGRTDQRARILHRILELDPGDADARQALAGSATPAKGTQRGSIDAPPPASVVQPGAPRDAANTSPAAPRGRPGSRDVEDSDEEILIEDEGSQAAAAPRGAKPDPAREAQIARLLNECAVFQRYGLKQKVIEQLERVLTLDPGHVEARDRLKSAYLEANRVGDAISQLRMLVDLLLDDHPDLAVTALRELIALAPDDEDARQKLAILDDEPPFDGETHVGDDTLGGGAVEAASPVPEDDDAVMFVDDDAAESTATVDAFDDATHAGPPLDATYDDARPAHVSPPLETVQDGMSIGPATVHEHRLADETSEESRDASRGAGTSGGDDLTTIPGSALPGLGAEAFASPGGDADAFEAPAAEAAPVVPDAARPGPRAAPSPAEIEEILDEVEFYLAQGLVDEARETLTDTLASHPGHPLILEKLADLDGDGHAGDPALESEPEIEAEFEPEPEIEAEALLGSDVRLEDDAPFESVAGDGDDAFLLAERLAADVEPMDEPVGTAPAVDVDQVFAQFKKGVEEQIGLEDTDTHFDLGIAYKEMGLLDDAIGEFKLSMANPVKECLAHTMIGLCFVEKGAIADAIGHFKKGLYCDTKSEREELGLYFELGAAYELLHDPKEALYYFQKVQKRDAGFRNAAARVRALAQPRPAPPPPAPSATDDVDRAFDDLMGGGDEG